MENVRIFDTTLRDGEQSPGATLSLPEKVEIAKLLEAMGVDIIEAGFPISSDGDFESVRQIAQVVSKSVICGLARCVKIDIERAGEAVKPAKHGRIHTFISSSDVQIQHQLRSDRPTVLRRTREMVGLARSYVDDVEFSAMDASRTDLTFLTELVAAAIEAGATTINLPDTVGYATPQEYGSMFRKIRARLPVITEKKIVLSSHCHDDLGLAVANSLSAVENGVRQVECTINGIGERAGNAALEEIVMALRTRRDFYDLDTRLDATKIYAASRMVSSLTGLMVQRNKAIIGQNAFAHESGIHQDGVLKHRETFEIMNPDTVGVPKTELVMGKHSGRAAFKDRVQQLGYTLSDTQVEETFLKFKTLADKKKELFDEDIEALIDTVLERQQNLWELQSLQVMSGTNSIPTATLTLKDSNGDL
ncbi:MAG TPA: 2-isopropylmalate synthase, partial [Tepidisphaeraceae bacterium]